MPKTLLGRPEAGDHAPVCFGMGADRRFYSFEEQYGRPAILILIGADAGAALAPMLAALQPYFDAFAHRNTDVLLLVDENPAFLQVRHPSPLPVRVIDCGDFLARCRVGARDTLLMLLDRNLRIALTLNPTEEPEFPQACLACLEGLPAEAPRDVYTPAPAIVLPNLLSRSMCDHLIEMFNAGPTLDGRVARVDAAGRISNVVDHSKKRRRDMLVEPGSGLHSTLQQTLLDRCRPEIAKAFQARVAFTDRILVARYDDNGGWFRRHRDNEADNVAFREFALSLNLNTGEYEGGHLVFPEYNDHRYHPPAGGGVIFSTAVLHEAAPVISGLRYVLLTFFHGEASEMRRQAWEAKAMAEHVAA